MQLDNLRQAPFSSTFMGALRGALDYYGIGATDGHLYGASGHAFAMNIHKQLCPSGPYCFDRSPIFALLENLGIHAADLGFYYSGSSPEERAGAEARLRDALEGREPCMLVNMEFQLITGCDATGFRTAQPWPGHDFPPAHLTFGTWAELGDEVHMNLYVLRHGKRVQRAEAVRAALGYAVDLWRNAAAHGSEDYGMGPNAYANWRAAIEAGHGAGHGCWWNGMVWGECRGRAADFLREAAPVTPDEAGACAAAQCYADVAANLHRCADKEMPVEAKLERLAEAERQERLAIDHLEALLAGWT